MTVWVNKAFEVNGDHIELDYTAYQMLNLLAVRFYSAIGYEVDVTHDFFESKHPQENKMFELALEAYAFNLTVGLD